MEGYKGKNLQGQEMYKNYAYHYKTDIPGIPVLSSLSPAEGLICLDIA